MRSVLPLALILASCSTPQARADRDPATAEADAAFQAGDYPRAGLLYESLLDKHPDFARAALRVALCLERSARVEEALKSFDRVRSLAPEGPEAREAEERIALLRRLRDWDPVRGPRASEILE